MAVAPKRVDVTSADTQQLGFEYQYLYFIVRLLQLRAGCEVGYEALDDIHVITDSTRETQYIQVKHTTDLSADGSPANLTTLSEDLWKTLSNWSKLLRDPAEQRDTAASQKKFVQNSRFIFATNRNTCKNRVTELIDAVKGNTCTGTNPQKILRELKKLTRNTIIQGYIDDVCSLAPSILCLFLSKIEFVSTADDLFAEIRSGIMDKMVPESDVNDVLSKLYTQLKEDFFKVVKNKQHQIITYNEWQQKYQSVFNSVRTTLLPFREYRPILPDHLDQQPFAKELIEIEAIDTGMDGLSELAEFTEHYLSVKMQLSDWYEEGKIDFQTLQRFHYNAYTLWKRIHKACHRSTKSNTALDRTNALDCFDKIMQEQLKMLSTELDISLSNGEFILLANKEKIGWKYKWNQ